MENFTVKYCFERNVGGFDIDEMYVKASSIDHAKEEFWSKLKESWIYPRIHCVEIKSIKFGHDDRYAGA